MKRSNPLRPLMFSILNILAEYYPELEPLRQDSDYDLISKYFYWVDEYNNGHDPRHFPRPEFV